MRDNKMTMRDIARESGVSVATVSRYMNKVSYTSPETEKKIQEVLDRFNYTPNAIARGLAKQKSNTIALITPDITNPFFPELVKSIERVSKHRGYSLILINMEKDDMNSLDFWNNFKSRYIDGFLLAESDLSIDTSSYLESLGIPYIRIDRAVNSGKHDSVGVNNFEGARLAIKHLKEIGCRNIAHISGPKNLFPARERLNGYRSMMQEYDFEPIVYEGDFKLESGMIQTQKLIADHPEVDGIFYANDLMAVGALRTFKKLQRKIPEDIAIIGFDGIQLTELTDPEISTVRQPIDQIGELATGNLIGIIEKSIKTDKQSVILDVELIVRESTKRG